MKNKLTEQILKAIVNWNGQNMIWDKKFLSYQDNYELVFKNVDENTIEVSTKLKQ